MPPPLCCCQGSALCSRIHCQPQLALAQDHNLLRPATASRRRSRAPPNAGERRITLVGNDCGNIPSGFGLFSVSPRLKRWRCDYSLSRNVLPWAQLEDVAFKVDYEPGLAPIIFQMRRLREAVVDVVTQGDFSDTVQEPDIVWPPTLVNLIVQVKLSPTTALVPNPIGFLDRCTFDHLQSLSIRPDEVMDGIKRGNIG